MKLYDPQVLRPGLHSGRSAFISGAGSGIGRAIALRLLAPAAAPTRWPRPPHLHMACRPAFGSSPATCERQRPLKTW